MSTTGKVDQEMRDLLIRLDQRVDDGFRNINSKLDEMNRRADGHETRIRSLEDWRTEFRGGTKSVLGIGKVGQWAISALIGIAAALGFQFAVVPKDKPATAPATVQRH